MFKMLLGAAVLVLLVGFGVLSSDDVKIYGEKAVNFLKNDVKPLINQTANKISEATK
jgi:hypothetical protein